MERISPKGSSTYKLLVMLAIHASILRSVFRILRDKKVNARIRGLAVGCAAIYFNILLNGMFNASFGGRAGGTFIVLLALLVIGERLTYFARRLSPVAIVVQPAASRTVFVTPRTA